MIKKLTVFAILMAILFLNFGDLVHQCKMTGEFVFGNCACETVGAKTSADEKQHSCSPEEEKQEKKIITQTSMDNCCLDYEKTLSDFATTGIEFVQLKNVTFNFESFFIAANATVINSFSSVKHYRGPPISQDMASTTALQVLYCTYLI